MDHIIKNSRREQSEFKIVSNEKKYFGLLELIDGQVKITLTLGLSQFKWCAIYSIEQLQKISGVFIICGSIEKAYEYFIEILRGDSFEIKSEGQKIILTFTLKQFSLQVVFDIFLMQEEISTNDAVIEINHSILDMQKQIEELNLSQSNKDLKMKEQDQVINSQKNEIEELKISQKSQDEVITSQKNEIEELKNDIKQIQEENKILLNFVEKSFKSTIRQRMYSEILCIKELERIHQWINESKNKMELKLVYRATVDGFETSKFYEKCANITPTLIVIETNNNKRFGGYTDILWKNYGNYVVSNPNKSFLFSLDLDKKYTSNETNCSNAIYASGNYAFGGGHDLVIQNNSNCNYSSYTNGGHTYGKNEGISKYDLTGGSYNFMTREIEVFQVLFN